MIEKIKNVIRNNYLIIYIIYFCIIFIDTTTFTIDYPVILPITKVIRYIVYVLFLLRFIILLPDYIKKLNLKNWKNKNNLNKFVIIISVVVGICAIVNFIKTGNKRILILMLVLLSSYQTDYKKIIKWTMIMQAVLTSLTTLASVTNITQNYTVMRPSGEKRYSLGFIYTTNLSQMIIFSTILYLYNKDFKVDYFELFVMQILNTLIYFITDSRTEFLMLECIIIFMFIYKSKIWTKIHQIVKKIIGFFSYTFFIYPIISFVMVLLYPIGGIFNKIDIILSYRLSQTYGVLTEHGITLFGENIEFIGYGLQSKLKYGNVKSNYVDNEYIQMMFKEGIIIAVCFIIIMSILLIILYKKNKQKELFLCVVYLSFGLMNPRIISLAYCPILFLIIPIFTEYFEVNNKVNHKLINQKE